MEDDDMKHSHLVRKESRASPQAGKDSSPDNTHSQGKDPTHERESSASGHKEHSSITINNILLPNPKRLRLLL
jgi:hypothetical protein